MARVTTQVFEIPFAQGRDRKTNAKLLPVGKLLALEDGHFVERKSIQQRNGYTALARDILGGGQLESGDALARYRDELLLFDAGTAYSYSTALAKWVSRGGVTPFSATAGVVFGNAAGIENPDAATVNGVTVYAWADSRGGVRATVQDEATGAAFLADTEVTATGRRPRCVAIGDHLFVVYLDGANVRAKYISSLDPSAFSGEFTLRVDGIATDDEQHLDVDAIVYGPSDVAMVVYTSAAGITTFYLLESGQVGDGANGYPGPGVVVGADAEQALTVLVGDPVLSGRIFLLHAGVTGLWCTALDYNLVAGAPGVIDADADIINVTACPWNAEWGRIRVYYELEGATATENRVKTARLDDAGGLENELEYLRSVGLASKAWLAEDGNAYVVTVFAGAVQSTYFVLQGAGDFGDTARVIGRLLSQNAGGLQAGQLPSINELDESNVFWAAPVKTRFVSEANVTYSRIGLAKSSIAFDDTNRFRGAQAAETFLLPGGQIGAYDGQSTVEAGFHVFPEGIAAPVEADDGVMAADGRYAFTWIYEWYDNRGQVHRSAPAVPVVVDVAAGADDVSLAFDVPTLRVTEKRAPRADVRIVMFSTIKNGRVFYRTGHEAGSAVDGIENDPEVDSLPFKRTVADVTIQGNEFIYSQGTVGVASGELANIAPPAARFLAVGKRRVVLAGLEDPCALWYSKLMVAGRAVEFSDALQLRVTEDGGPITAVAFLDDKIIVFKRDAIYVVSGPGPDNTGRNGAFVGPDLLTTDVGCIEPRSIAETPVGICFQSARGIHHLSRGLELSAVGADVEDHRTRAITSALLVEDASEVRFLTDDASADARALVFDYEEGGSWATWRNHRGRGSVIWNDTYHYLRTDGTVYVESEDVHTDNGVAVHMKFRTGWLPGAGSQSWKRVRRLALLGDWLSAHRLRGRIYRDYRDFPEDTFIFDPAEIFDASAWGDGNFGDGNWGGDAAVADRVYQMRHHLKNQKCEAISIEVEAIGSDPGRAFAISSLALEVALLGGVHRMPSQKTV